MYTFLTHALAFVAGCIFWELTTWYQEHRALQRFASVMHAQSDPPDAVLSCWSADPTNWCDRPGCPRCWGNGGTS